MQNQGGAEEYSCRRRLCHGVTPLLAQATCGDREGIQLNRRAVIGEFEEEAILFATLTVGFISNP